HRLRLHAGHQQLGRHPVAQLGAGAVRRGRAWRISVDRGESAAAQRARTIVRMSAMIPLTLAHSPDPDDAFMWWPLTGMVTPTGESLPGPDGRPAIDTGRFSFTSLPLDIEVLNRRAIEDKNGLDITALSVRTWADVQDRYAITSCGA